VLYIFSIPADLFYNQLLYIRPEYAVTISNGVHISIVMAPSLLHLPNGQTLTVTPIFGGLYFKSNELMSAHHLQNAFPPGWTVVINTVDGEEEIDSPVLATDEAHGHKPHAKRIIHPYHKPTLRHDHLFISSISQPPSSEFKAVTSATRQIAMMLWATMLWYFQQPQPDQTILTKQSAATAKSGRPKADWRIHINREGVFKSRVTLPKLERMGLISTEDSSIGAERDERTGEGWLDMFVSRRSFWQLDPRLYLFTMTPSAGSPFGGGTPMNSRPTSPNRQIDERSESLSMVPGTGRGLPGTQSPTPYTSASHLPTYYPPPPPQYVFTNHVRHPLRYKPGKQGEIVYTRYVPSFGQYLSFRIASLSPKTAHYKGPLSTNALMSNARSSMSDNLPGISNLTIEDNDVDLKRSLGFTYSFPVIGCWDGKPFGYFELYWCKEDPLGRIVGEAGNYDRGIHCLIGEEEFRGPLRVQAWLSSLIHYLFMADNRTEVIMMEPRVDNEK
jgi:hypothetical protein